jgi:hypothetical protein
MAIKLQDKQNTVPPNAIYPNGNIRDDDGSGNGTPVNVDVYGDFHQFFARLLASNGVSPNGLPDNAYDGFQYYESLQNMLGDRIINSNTLDLNNYTEPGIYAITIITPINAPFPIGNAVGADPAIMIVSGFSKISGGSRTQTIFTRNGWAYRVYARTTGTFQSWNGQYQKTMNIPAWNMDANPTVVFAHGLTGTKILKVEATIRADGAGVGAYLSLALHSYSAQAQQGGVIWDGTNIVLERLTGGIFDNASYSAVVDFFGAYNRGSVIITSYL